MKKDKTIANNKTNPYPYDTPAHYDWNVSRGKPHDTSLFG